MSSSSDVTNHESSDSVLARHQAFVDAMESKRALDWDTWSMHVHESRCLTPAGRNVALWSVNVLRSALGPDFPQCAMSSGGHPIFSLNLWPANNVPWVYANLFQLALHLDILKAECKPIRKSLRNVNIGPVNWVHTLLQLEVAGLGLRAGWTVAFEPEYSTGRKADVLLKRGAAELFVDNTSMRMSDEEIRTYNVMHAVSEQMQEIRFRHDVQITGSVDSVAPSEELARCLRDLDEVATATARDGLERHVAAPGGGMLRLRREPDASELFQVTGPLVQTDGWSRLVTRLGKKSDQAAGSGKIVWVRLEDFSGTWHFTGERTTPLADKFSIVAPFLQNVLDSYPNLSGVIVAPSMLWAGSMDDEQVREVVVNSGRTAAAIRCPIPGHRARETIVVTRTDQPDTGFEVFLDMYSHEDEWLDWALARSGHPPFGQLVQESDARNEA